MNLGVRWEPYITVRDAYGENTAFRAGQQSTVYPLAPLGYLFPGDKGIDGLGVVPNRMARFSPRFGFAYDPFGDGKTSIRGGYGIFSDTIQLVSLNSNGTSQPFSYGLTTFNVQLSDPYGNSPQQLQLLETYQRATSATQRATKAFYLPVTAMSMNPDFTSAYVQQWNLNLQRELPKKVVLTVAYLGNKGTHLHVSQQVNQAVYVPGNSTTGNVDSRRLYQGYQTIESIQSTANSTYHSLQVSWNRRFENGFTFLGSYVFSKALDLASTDGNSGLANQASNPFNWDKDRGLANFNVKHRFVTSLIWDVPFFHRLQGLQAGTAGWMVVERDPDLADRHSVYGAGRRGSQPGRHRTGSRGYVGTGGNLQRRFQQQQGGALFRRGAFRAAGIGHVRHGGPEYAGGPGLSEPGRGCIQGHRDHRAQEIPDSLGSLQRPESPEFRQPECVVLEHQLRTHPVG